MTSEKHEIKITRSLTTIRNRLAQIDSEAERLQQEAETLAKELAHRALKKNEDREPEIEPEPETANAIPVVHQQNFHVGDDCTPEVLVETVKRAIAERPRTRQELIELTGARGNRVNGALIQLQINGYPLKNLGNRYRAVWYLTSIAKPK